MKFKWMVLAIFLVGLFAISAVAAADNATDDTALVYKTADEAAIDNLIIDDSDSDMELSGDSLGISDFPADELKGEDINLTVEHKKVMTNYDVMFIALSDDDGQISILVDGQKVYGDNNFWFYDFYAYKLFSGIDYGNHTLEVKYLGNQYNPTSYKSTFFYSYVDLYADSKGHIIIDSEEEMSAKLYLDGDLIYSGKIDGDTTVSSKNLYRGYIPNYTLITSGKGKYNAITLTGALNYQFYPEIDVPSTMGKGDNRYIEITMPPDANGNLKVYLNDIDTNASFENGKSVIALNTLDIGDYNVRIVYDSDSKYESYDDDYHVKVTYNPNFKITLPAVAYLTDSTITFTGLNDVDGKISIYVDRFDKTFEGDYKNGIAKIKIFDENPGPKTYLYKFEGTYNGEKFEYNGEFNVTLTLFNVSLPKTIYEGQSFKVTFTGPKNLNGDLYVSNMDDIYIVKNGKTTVTFKGLNVGKKTFVYSFSGQNIWIDDKFKVNVIKNPINAADFKIDYLSKKKYQVRILDNNAKPVSDKTVTFYLYKASKKLATKTAKTDSKGYAKVNFNAAPGVYNVKIKYGSASLTKKYTVKPIISIKEVHKYKRYTGLSQLVTAKKFVFQAALKKVDGKYLKGKKVTITFYRQYGKLIKVYSATKKTNSKGIVKFSYNKLPFKITHNELEGLLIAVKFSYLDENDWGTLNVGSQSPPKYYLYSGW